MTGRILTITSAQYNAERATVPALTASLAKTIITKSPAHARAERTAPTKAMDGGSLIHSLLLDGGEGLKVIEADNYRTKVAQEDRDLAHADGRTPVLTAEYFEGLEIARIIKAKLKSRGIILNGSSAVAVQWLESSLYGPVPCRCLFDHLWLDEGVFLEFKTAASAHPDAFARQAYVLGYDIALHAYTRALEALRPELAGRTRAIIAAAETQSPHPVSVFEPDGSTREMGARRWARAVETYARCIADDYWPGYQRDDEIGQLSVPVWALSKEMPDE